MPPLQARREQSPNGAGSKRRWQAVSALALLVAGGDDKVLAAKAIVAMLGETDVVFKRTAAADGLMRTGIGFSQK
ncbi:MAG: hypothetical protein WD894_25765 [Pirellulales bacterium]